MMITLDELKQYLRYEPETGDFWWRVKGRGRKNSLFMKPAGFKRDGYNIIGLLGGEYRAHRLAFFYVNGRWPREIDHINGNRADNRIGNLRECTRQQNTGNVPLRRNNKSGYRGVRFYGPRQKWTAAIKVNGRNIHLGYFASPELAYEVYVLAAKQHFGEFFSEVRA